MTSATGMAHAWNQWEGQIINGKFPLLAYLGGTEHSAVFHTERPEGEPRKAAIKLLPANDITVEALLARWTASSPQSHPDLLRMFEMGRGTLGNIDFAYALMEYADDDLASVDRPLAAAEASDMLDGVFKALAYLHAKGVAHGRLKPSNILAVGDQLKISSDTIRPIGEWRSNLDAPGPYDPPEIAREGASIEGDVWSVGVTLVEALTKQMPAWDGDTLAPSTLESLPPAFRRTVSNCLRLDPRQRSTVEELAKSLMPQTETPVRPQNELSPASTANRRYFLPAGAVGLVLVAAAMVPRLGSNRASRPPADAPELKADQAELKADRPDLKKEAIVVPPEPQPVRPQARHTSAPKSSSKSPDPGIITRVLPDVPTKARNTIRGKVTINVWVRVGADGSVVGSRNESLQSSRFFGNLAVQAARRWKFQTGGALSREWNLRFQFIRDAKRPVSVQAVPAP